MNDWPEQERAAVEKGKQRYHKQRESAKKKNVETRFGPPRTLAQRLLQPTEDLIKQRITTATAAGINRSAVPYIESVSPAKIALITVRTVLDAVSHKGEITLHTYARRIASRIHTEILVNNLYQSDRTTFNRITRANKTRQRTEVESKRAFKRAIKNSSDINWETWPTKVIARVGYFCLDALTDSTGLFELKTIKMTKYSRPRNANIFGPTKELIDLLYKADSRAEVLTPWTQPTFEPPVPWTKPYNGGYTKIPTKLVKTRDQDYLEKLRQTEIPNVYRSLNAIQSVPFQIDHDVLNTLESVWEADTRLGSIPAQSPTPIPTKPDKDDDTAYMKWKFAAKNIHVANNRRKSQALTLATTLGLARQYANQNTLYYPSNLDFRGRIYPLPIFLSHCATESIRSLLRFSKPKPITTEAQHQWLMIHGANCWGRTKDSFSERLDWVDSNKKLINDIASDPLTNTQWSECDKPYLFLAWAFEYQRFLDHGWGYESGLPVAMDGTANGYQHLSACILDEKAAPIVNMTKLDRPSDIYSVIADKVTEIVALDAKSDPNPESIPALWLRSKLINRSLCKAPTMTSPYGLMAYGLRQQVYDFINDAYDGAPTPFGTLTPEAVNYLYPIIKTSIEETIIAARETMQFLKSVAHASAHDNIPITWTNPAGLTIKQSYQNYLSKRITTRLSGQMVKAVWSTPTPETNILKKKAVNAISPNFIHGMDSGHLMMTIIACLKERPDMSFATIHDSFSTTAADAPLLASCIREEFVKIYKTPVLEKFYKQVTKTMTPEAKNLILPIPEMGNLDLNEILEADYFFS